MAQLTTTTLAPTGTSGPSTLTTSLKAASTPNIDSFFPSSSASFAAQPSSNDSAPNGNNNGGLNSGGLASYYLVFLALLLCCLALSVFFMFKRRAKMRANRRRGTALQQDVGPGAGPGGWYGDPAVGPRRFRHGRWEGGETGREEGLNEDGEAPPPYLAKRQSEERRRGEGVEEGGPAIPMETLSRDDVGLKPPDYSERMVHEPDAAAVTSSVPNASSSRMQERPMAS